MIPSRSLLHCRFCPAVRNRKMSAALGQIGFVFHKRTTRENPHKPFRINSLSPVPSLWKLASFRRLPEGGQRPLRPRPTRRRRTLGSFCIFRPPGTRPCPGRIGFVSHSLPRGSAFPRAKPNWVRFAHLPRVPRPCVPVPSGPPGTPVSGSAWWWKLAWFRRLLPPRNWVCLYSSLPSDY